MTPQQLKLGPPLALSEKELDALALITPEDILLAQGVWRRLAKGKHKRLLDAAPSFGLERLSGN